MTGTQGAAHEGDAEPNPIDAPGTAEADWRSWRLLDELPILDIGGWSSVVVVAAHPDDEVLGPAACWPCWLPPGPGCGWWPSPMGKPRTPGWTG